MLHLPNWPIASVISVVDKYGTIYTEGDKDFVITPSPMSFSLKRNEGTWASGVGNFTVQYQAGYITIPSDIVLVCYEMIARKWKTMKEQGWGESSRSFPDGSTASVNADGEFNKSQLAVLAKYRRLSI